MFGYMIRSLFYVFQLASEKLYEYWRQNNPDIRKVLLIPKTSSPDKFCQRAFQSAFSFDCREFYTYLNYRLVFF